KRNEYGFIYLVLNRNLSRLGRWSFTSSRTNSCRPLLSPFFGWCFRNRRYRRRGKRFRLLLKIRSFRRRIKIRDQFLISNQDENRKNNSQKASFIHVLLSLYLTSPEGRCHQDAKDGILRVVPGKAKFL